MSTACRHGYIRLYRCRSAADYTRRQGGDGMFFVCDELSKVRGTLSGIGESAVDIIRFARNLSGAGDEGTTSVDSLKLEKFKVKAQVFFLTAPTIGNYQYYVNVKMYIVKSSFGKPKMHPSSTVRTCFRCSTRSISMR